MTKPRRRLPGLRTTIPIETAEEYQIAVAELAVLQKARLGTDETEFLQDLIEAILDYEERRNGTQHPVFQ